MVCKALASCNFEWQLGASELKLKCRTKINESDIEWDDFSYFSVEEFLRKNFVKFTVQLHRWSRELSDTYLVDFVHIKSGVFCLFDDQIHDLLSAISRDALFHQLQIIPTVALAEETLPNKGQGFEIVPSALGLNAFGQNGTTAAGLNGVGKGENSSSIQFEVQAYSHRSQEVVNLGF